MSHDGDGVACSMGQMRLEILRVQDVTIILHGHISSKTRVGSALAFGQVLQDDMYMKRAQEAPNNLI